MVKRILIFCFYDKEGIVDDYVIYLLRKLQKFVERIIIVSNCELREEERAKFQPFSAEIVVRENKGYDAAAWREIMVEHCGWQQLTEYDELILMNDTVYGPLKDMSVVFDSESGYDVWGITSHGAFDNGSVSYPAHIQSYFMAFHRNVIEHPAFQKYWTEMPIYQDVNELIMKHEVRFTQFLADLGFSWHAFCDMSKYERNSGENIVHYFYNQYGLMQEAGCPFAKKKLFVWYLDDSLLHGDGGNAKRSYEWIRDNCDYDTSLMIKNLLRTEGWGKVKEALGLKYIVRESTMKASGKNVALCFVVQEQAILGEYASRLKALSEDFLVVAVEDFRDKKELINQIKERLSDNIDYLCIYHLEKEDSQRFYTVELDKRRQLWNDIISGPEYIQGIVRLFEKDANVGALVPAGFYWAENSQFEKEINYELDGIWIRKELLDILELNFSKKTDVRELYDIMAKRGYMVGEIQCEKSAENRIAAYEHMLRSLQEENRIAKNLSLRIKRYIRAKLPW